MSYNQLTIDVFHIISSLISFILFLFTIKLYLKTKKAINNSAYLDEDFIYFQNKRFRVMGLMSFTLAQTIAFALLAKFAFL